MAGEWHLIAETDDIEEEDVLGVNVEGTGRRRLQCQG